MIRRVKTAVGLDITSSSMALALLRQDKNGIRLVRAARRPIKSDIRENPRAFRRIARELRRTCKAKAIAATCSLYSPRALLQIVDMPSSVSGHKGHYIEKEIRHYVSLAGVEIVSDYRDIHSTTEAERMFVAAGDAECVADTVNSCHHAGLDVEVVEPDLLAYIRAFYHQRVAGRFGCNVLLALLRDGKLSLAVMRERNVDFVRTHAIDDDPEDPEAVLRQLLAEIKIIMQYYEIEVADSTGHWEVNVIAHDDTSLPEQTQAFLTEGMEEFPSEVPLKILTSENMFTALSVELPEGIPLDQISAAAVGHAMRALSEEIVLPKINCLPSLLQEIQEIKRSICWTAIGAAMLLLFMGLAAMVLIERGNRVSARIAQDKPNSAVGQVVDERGALEAEIAHVGKIPKRLKEILGAQKNVNWAVVLSDIKEVIPEKVSITRFDTRSDLTVYIDGIALTANNVTLFLSRLGKSDHITSVDLVKLDYKSGINGHHIYEIKCQLMANVGT